MSKLNEIFKDSLPLLKEQAVQDLIAYFKKEHEKCYNINQELRSFQDGVIELCVHSDLVVKEGRTPKQTVELILELIEKS